MGRVGSFCRDFFIERRTIQNKILFPFIAFSFLAIIIVVILVVRILSQNIEETTSRDIITYKETVEAFFQEKEKQTVHYGNLLASFKGSSPALEKRVLHRTMDISHMDLLIKEGVQIYMDPKRFLQSGNRAQREMVKRGMKGEDYSRLIYKTSGNKTHLDYDVVVPFNNNDKIDIVIVGFSLDDAYLEEVKTKIKNDLFVLHNDRIIASTFHDASWREKIELRVTPEILAQTLGKGEPVLKKVLLSGKEYKAVFAPHKAGVDGAAVFGLIMSTNDLAQAKRQVVMNYVAVSLAIMAILTLINFFVVRAISRPLKAMVALTDRVAQGDLSQRILTGTEDELSTLADSYNNMVESLQKKREQLDLTVKQLIHQEKFASLGEMAAGVAHEVGNPLSIIVGYSKMLVKKCANKDEKGLLTRISEAALRIDKLTRSLLLYSRPSVQQQQIVDINRIMDDSLAMVEHRFKEEKNYRVVKRLSPKVRTVIGSKDKLQQVLVNLLINAFQAMPEGGVLTLLTEKSPVDDAVLIEVSDTGAGIKPDHFSKIFDPFFTTKSPDRGTGLGLSITQRIITDHGGSIRVESIQDHGTTFFIQLPCESEESNGENCP
jgi:signal transduction histidine kinase